MKRVFRLIRGAVFLGWLCLALISSMLAVGVFAVKSAVAVASLTVTVAKLTANATVVAAKNAKKIAALTATYRRQLATATLKAKAKARLRRFSTAIPIAVLTVANANRIAVLTVANANKIAVLTAANRRQLAKAVLRTKAKARLRRFVVAIPLAGIAAVAAFEELDYREWLEENPDGTRADYGCRTYTASVEVLDDFVRDAEPMLATLPSLIRPSRETVLGWLPECSDEPPSP